jgi:hypothetical protein
MINKHFKFEETVIDTILNLIKDNQEYLTQPENLPQLAKMYLLLLPITYLLMLITNNYYFFLFNWKFSDAYRNKQTIDYSGYNQIGIGFYQLFRGLYYFVLLGLCIWNIKEFPNIFFALFLTEFLRNLIRKPWWFLLVNLFGFISILIYAKSHFF